MKKLQILLALILLLPIVTLAQEDELYHELKIISESGKLITVQVPFGNKLNNDDSWKELIYAFRSDFRKVEASIPTFDFYEIDYTRGSSLEINEVVGKEIYSLGKEDKYAVIKSNYCHLRDKDIHIKIQFTKSDELFDDELIAEIEEGISENSDLMKKKFTRSNFFYDSKTKSTKFERNRSFGMGFISGFNLGYLRGNVVTEARIGFGLKIADFKMGIHGAAMFDYDQLTDNQSRATLLGFYLFGEDGGMDFMWKLNDNDNIMGRYNFRLSLKYKIKSFVVSVDNYGLFTENYHLGLSFGVGF